MTVVSTVINQKKRKEEWKQLGKDFRQGITELKNIPKQAYEEATKKPEKKKYKTKKDYILNEIGELNKEHKKIQKGMKWWLIGTICSLIVFFPLGIVAFIFMIIDAIKMGKIREQIKAKQREVDMIDIREVQTK